MSSPCVEGSAPGPVVIIDAAMPFVGQVSEAAAPPELSWDRRMYPSPDGARSLVFSDPAEFAIGTCGWKVRLFENDKDVTRRHRKLKRATGTYGADVSPDMSPWRADSDALVALRARDEAAVVTYDVRDKRVTHLPESLYPLTAQWSPTGGELLIPTTSGFDLYEAGVRHRTIPWNGLPREKPLTGWVASGASWFVIGRLAEEQFSQIRFFSPRGEALEEQRLDPLDVFPYDHERFASISSDRFSLIRGPGIRSIGNQLRRWTDARLNVASNQLLLETARPTSDPFEQDGEMVCAAEARWALAELVEDQAGG